MRALACVFLPFIFLPFIFLAACVGTVPSRYEVRDLRVISVVAEPPEVSPGDTVTLTAYFEDPVATAVTATMQQCPNLQTQSRDITCVDTPSAISLASEAATPAFGLANVFSAQLTYTEPLAILQGLSPLVQSYGYYDQMLFHGVDVHRSIDASKRIVVTPASITAKNHNPSLMGFEVIEELASSPDIFGLQRGKSYTLKPIYDASSLESYSVTTYTGQVQHFTEEATFVWSCAQSCDLDRDTTYADQTTTLSLPLDWSFGDSLLVNVVMRDGRGGEVPFVRSFRVFPYAD